MKDALKRLIALGREHGHVAAAVNVGRRGATTKVVSHVSDERDEQVTAEELERQDGEQLPERTQMSVLDPGGPFATLPVEPPDVA